MTRSNKIRISGGKFKGRGIELPLNDTTRTSKSIVRASVADSLQCDMLDATFIEVFAGSGSVGIEALSRGAGYAIFCEKDKLAYDFLTKNLEALKIKNAKAYLQDSFTFFENLKNLANDIGAPNIFYFDPPFEIRDGMQDIYEKTFKLIESLPVTQAVCAVIEARTGIEAPQNIGEFTLDKSRTFGQTTVLYYRPNK